MRSRADLVADLLAAGYARLDDDPLAAVELLHRPSPRKGLFGAEPMHSIALLDFLGDSPSRFLELALGAGRLVDQVVTGSHVGDALDHPTLRTLAALMSPGKRSAPSWRHPPHRVLIALDAAPAPPWAAAVLDGCIHDHHRRCSLAVVRDETSGGLLLPTPRSPRMTTMVHWAQSVLEGDDREAADTPAEG